MRSKGIADSAIINRIVHAISDLINRRLLEAHIISQGATTARCVLTDIGRLVVRYIEDD